MNASLQGQPLWVTPFLVSGVPLDYVVYLCYNTVGVFLIAAHILETSAK